MRRKEHVRGEGGRQGGGGGNDTPVRAGGLLPSSHPIVPSLSLLRRGLVTVAPSRPCRIKARFSPPVLAEMEQLMALDAQEDHTWWTVLVGAFRDARMFHRLQPSLLLGPKTTAPALTQVRRHRAPSELPIGTESGARRHMEAFVYVETLPNLPPTLEDSARDLTWPFGCDFWITRAKSWRGDSSSSLKWRRSRSSIITS